MILLLKSNWSDIHECQNILLLYTIAIMQLNVYEKLRNYRYILIVKRVSWVLLNGGRSTEENIYNPLLQRLIISPLVIEPTIKVIMPPTSKKLEGHIASGLFVRPSVRSSRFLMHSITLEPWKLLFWNFLYEFLMKKIADTCFSLDRIMPLFWVMALWKNMDANLSAKYLKNYWS